LGRIPEDLRIAISERTQVALTASPEIAVLTPSMSWEVEDHASKLHLVNGSNLSILRSPGGAALSVVSSNIYQDVDQLDQRGCSSIRRGRVTYRRSCPESMQSEGQSHFGFDHS